MPSEDTIKLLRECNAGVKMGIASIDDVLDKVTDDTFKSLLTTCKQEHSKLDDEIKTELDKFGDDGKEPNPLAKGMSHMKTDVKTMMEPGDQTIADLITEGCNMGVKSLRHYLNQYSLADATAKGIAQRLIQLEKQLTDDIAIYL